MNKVSKCLENVPNMMTEKIWRFYVEKYQYARKRARMCVRAFFCKMLKMAWNVCKMNLGRFWAFLFFARALTRGRTHARAFSDLKLTGRILTLIMINMNEKCLSVMKIWSWVKSTKKKHKMAPGWRHEDLMTLKMLHWRLMTMTYDCAKIERNWINWSWVILLTKKWEQ